MPKRKRASTQRRVTHKELVLEIGTEELPPRDIGNALLQLENSLRRTLGELRIELKEIKTFGTPRRLVAICTGVSTQQRPAHLPVKGPPETVAYDSRGRPTEAVLGFARSQGVEVSELKPLGEAGRRYIFAIIKIRGEKTTAVLPEVLANVAKSLSFSKTMRWNGQGTRFARPIRWVVALFDDTVLPVSIGGVKAGNKTYGHRYLRPRRYAVKNAREYLKVIRAAKVIIDPEERQRRIVEQTRALASEVNGLPVLEDSLLEETVMSVEHPQALRGEFSRAYRDLPREVLVTVMQHHQKYFPVEDIDHKLQPYFIAVRDGDASGLDKVRQGHEWVLAARLADARFFFDLDRKRSLEQFEPMLEGVTFYEQLGTMADKTRRLQRLSEYLAVVLMLDGRSANALHRAAELCKADLVTHMVGEFPELQGVIGGIYAGMDGEPAEVARAISEHYRPAGADDRSPATKIGALLALADKTDMLTGGMVAGLTPTGSQDPYGLRRAGHGIVDIVLAHRLKLPLRPFVAKAAEGYGRGRDKVNDVVEFLHQRLRAALIDRGLRYDLVDAALAVSEDDLLAAASRSKVLQDNSKKREFARLYIAYDRASRILTGTPPDRIDPDLFEDESERILLDAVRRVKGPVEQAVTAGDYDRGLDALLPLTAPVDRLFDTVLIMAPDERVRANRLALLAQVVEIFRNVADFSKVVISDEEKFGNRAPGTGNRATTGKQKKT